MGKKRPIDVIDIFGGDGSIVIDLGSDAVDMPVIKIVNDDEPHLRDDFTESSVGESVAAQSLQNQYMDAKERRRVRDREKRAKLLEDQTEEGKAVLEAILQRRREKDRARREMRRGDTSDEGQRFLEAQRMQRKENERQRRLRKEGGRSQSESSGDVEDEIVVDKKTVERSSSGYIQDDCFIEINIS